MLPERSQCALGRHCLRVLVSVLYSGLGWDLWFQRYEDPASVCGSTRAIPFILKVGNEGLSGLLSFTRVGALATITTFPLFGDGCEPGCQNCNLSRRKGGQTADRISTVKLNLPFQGFEILRKASSRPTFGICLIGLSEPTV